MTDDGIISKSHLEYQRTGNPRKDTIDLTMKLRYTSPPSRSLTTTMATIDIHTSAWPEYNSIVHWNFQFAEGHVENTISVDTTERRQRVQLAHLQQILQYGGTLVSHHVDSTFGVKIPSKQVDFMFKVDHRNSERALFSKVLLRRSLDKEHGLEISIRDDSEEEWRVSGHLIILNSGSPSMISMNVTEKLSMTPTESHKYVWRLLTTGRPFGNITATMHYNNLNTDMAVSQGLRISMDGDVQFFGQGSMFLSVSEGHLKGDARFSDQNYHIALNYTEVRWKQYDGNFTIILSSKQRLYGKLFLNTDNEKSLHVDAKSNTTGRRVIAKTTIHHRDDHKEGRFYLEWDADRDPKQRLLLTALNERLPERGQVHVGFDYMEKTIGFLFNHYRRALPDTDFNIQQLETIVEWSGSKKLGADLNITSNREQRNIVGTLDVLTPVSQLLEEAVVSLTHSSDALGWKSDANLVVNRKLPFNLTSTGKYWRAGNQRYLDVTANANTPFEGFKRMGFGVQHSKASREISTKATVEWSPRDKIDLHLYGIIPNGTKFDEVIAHLNVNTPFSNFKNLIFGLDHRIDSNRINSSMKVLWNEREKLAISLRATSQRINSIYKGTGSLIVVTPPQTFGNFSMLLDHVHHTHGFSTHLTGLLPNDNFSWKGEGIFQRADLFTILRVGTDFESSTLNFGSGLKYEHHGSHFDSELRGNWKAKRLHFTAVGAYRSMTDFHFRGTSLTHLERFKTGAVILTNKMGDGSIVSELLGRLNNTDLRGIHLSGNWNWSEEASRNLDMNFRLNAPLPSLPYILLNVSHSRQHRSVLTTHVNGTWNDVDVVLNHVLTFRNWYHFSDTLVASLPFDGWQDLQMAIDQSWGEGHRRTSANLTVTQDTLLGISLNVEPRILQDGKRKINASGKLESSLWASRGIEIIVDHTDNREEYQPKIIVQTIKDPKTRLIDLNGFLRSFPGNKIWYLKINSPMLELKDVALTGMYSMSDTYLIFNVSVHTDTSTKWEVDGRLETDFYAPRVRFNIVTPQEGYRVAKFDGHYSVWTSQKLIIFIVQKEEWKLDIYGNGRFDPDDVDAGMVIQTPSSDVRTIHLNVSANWDKSRRRGFRTSLTWGDKKRIVINTYLQPYRNGVTTMSVSVTTPLPWLRNVDGVLKVSRKPDSRLLIETSVRWNRADVVEVLMILGQDRSTLFDHAISIKSTSPVVPQVAVILLSKTTSHLHTTKASLEMVGLTFNVDLEAKFHHRHTELQLVVLTPFISFPKGSLAGTIRHKSNDVHDINLILMLPIRGLGSITLNGSLTPIGIRAPKTTLSIATSKWSASLVTHYAPNNTGFLLTASTTPLLPIWQISEMELAWQTIFEDASLRALLIAEGGRHELLGRVKGPPSNRLLTGRVSSPLLKDKSPIEFQMHVQNQNPTDVHTELIIREANANKHRATLDINIDEPTSASLNFAGVTPLIGDGHWYNVSVDVRDTTTGIASLAVLTIPTGTYRWKSQYDRDLTSGLVSLLLDGETPIESMKRLKVYARKLGKEWDNVATNLEIVTPIKGYDSFGAALSTDHIFGQTFDAKVQLTTPFEGYEDIAFEEHITYDLNLRGISTETNFIFDGVKTVFGGRYTNGKEQPWEVGFGTRWHRIQGEHHDGNGTVNFQWHCPKEGSQFDHHSCQIQYKWSGTPWGGQGTWNYNGWRNFTGDTSVVVPVTGIDKVVVLAANDMLTNREAFKSRVVIQWAGRTVSDVLLEGITLKNGQKNASLSLITPFMSAHRVNGRGFVFRDDTDVMGGVNIDLNDVQIFRGLLGTSTKQDGPWKNRTLLLETENPWQPLGLAASVHRHPLIFTFQSSITRNLAELHNGTKSLKADLEILLKPYGRDIHMTVNHPRHRMDISATYHRAPSNFTHAATVRWGAASSLLAAYRVWRHDIHQTGNFGGQNVGIRWEHPNRVMMATADLIRKSNGVHSTHIDVNLDATGDQEKYMTLDVEYEDARDTAPHGRDHIVRMVFWHPRLFQVSDRYIQFI